VIDLGLHVSYLSCIMFYLRATIVGYCLVPCASDGLPIIRCSVARRASVKMSAMEGRTQAMR